MCVVVVVGEERGVCGQVFHTLLCSLAGLPRRRDYHVDVSNVGS